MNSKLVCALVVVSAAGLMLGGGVGCGDSGGAGGGGAGSTATGTTTTSSKTSSTASGTGTGTATSTGTGGTCSVADQVDTCQHACEALYDCGALTCGANKNCPGFSGDAAEKTAFVGDAMAGCVQTCTAMPVLMAIIDPTNCSMTVGSIKMASAQFQMVCEQGFGGTTSSTGGG